MQKVSFFIHLAKTVWYTKWDIVEESKDLKSMKGWEASLVCNISDWISVPYTSKLLEVFIHLSFYYTHKFTS